MVVFRVRLYVYPERRSSADSIIQTSPVHPGPDQNKRGHNGGVWEWTSSVLDAHEGFIPSVIYPGYSSDFFDGSHNVVVGRQAFFKQNKHSRFFSHSSEARLRRFPGLLNAGRCATTTSTTIGMPGLVDEWCMTMLDKWNLIL